MKIIYTSARGSITETMDSLHSYRVELIYFKDTGKYYTDATCWAEGRLHLFQIWDLLLEMFKQGIRPGLIKGNSGFHVTIDVVNHPHRHPHLMLGVA